MKELRAEVQRLKLDLEKSLNTKPSATTASKNPLEQAFQTIILFDLLSSRWYQLKSRSAGSSPLIASTEQYLSGLASHFLSFYRDKSQKSWTYKGWVRRYRAIWKENGRLFLLSLFLFLGAIFLGWRIGLTEPDLVPVIVPSATLENVLGKVAWFESIQENPFIDGLRIAYNNIMVCINSFIAGALLGLGGLFFLGYNGLLFGALVGFCFAHGFHEELLQFVAGHGPLELSIIVASTFGSFLLGRAFYIRPFSKLSERLRYGARDATTIALGILPWLILAACIEVFVSPWPFIPPSLKIGIGVVAALVFWTWTLWPQSEEFDSATP